MANQRMRALLKALQDEMGQPETGTVDSSELRAEEEDQAIVVQAEVVELTNRLKKNTLPPKRADPLMDSFRSDLSAARLQAYCAAAAALMRGALLDAQDTSEAQAQTGRIESVRESPYFEVYPLPGSRLAQERGSTAARAGVRFGATEFAHQIALRCGEDLARSELAWRVIAESLLEGYDILPRLEVESHADGTVGVRLVPAQD